MAKETVSDLEIWYLGAGVIKSVKNPTEIEMANMEAELEQLWHRLKGQKTSIEKHPANPSPVRGFSEGGVPTTSPKEEKGVTDVIGIHFVPEVKVLNM